MAGHTATYSKLYPFIAPALVNGAAGAAVTPHGQLYSVMAFTVTDAKITHIDALAGPGRLAQLDLTFLTFTIGPRQADTPHASTRKIPADEQSRSRLTNPARLTTTEWCCGMKPD